MTFYIYSFPNLTLPQTDAVSTCFGEDHGKALAWVAQRRPIKGGRGKYFTKGDWKALHTGAALLERFRKRSFLGEMAFQLSDKKKKMVIGPTDKPFFMEHYPCRQKKDTLHGRYQSVMLDGETVSIKNFVNVVLKPDEKGVVRAVVRAKPNNKRVRGSTTIEVKNAVIDLEKFERELVDLKKWMA